MDPESMYADYDGFEEGYGDDMYSNEYFDDMDYGSGAYTRISIADVLERCIIPTISQTTTTVAPLLGLCLVHRLTSVLNKDGEYCTMVALVGSEFIVWKSWML